MATDFPENEESAPLSSLRRSLVQKAISVSDAVAVLPESQRSRMLLGIQTAVVARRRRRRQRVLLSCAAAIVLVAGGLAALLQSVRTRAVEATPTDGTMQWEEVDLGQIGHLRVRTGTDYLLPAFPPLCEKNATRVELRSGVLCAQINHRDPTMVDPLVVATPDFEVEVVGTEFCVEAWRGLSAVDVTEGVVGVHAGANPAVSVRAGEMVRSNEARLAARVPLAIMTLAPAPTSKPSSSRAADCASMGNVGERRRCYAVRALGNDVRAANALYSLALIDAEQLSDQSTAISELRSYQERFPTGFLSPEVSLMLIREFATIDWAAEAVGEAERFRARYPSHPRVEDVTLMEGSLLLHRLSRPADAASVYRTLIGRPLTAAQHESLGAALRHIALPSSQTQEGRR